LILKRRAIYLRVSTDEQTVDNQERELHAAAERVGHEWLPEIKHI
jgi:DNA invertase Pin-like site-specific DNA recombinase